MLGRILQLKGYRGKKEKSTVKEHDLLEKTPPKLKSGM